MGRKKSGSGAEAVMDVVALMPWWAGVLLAVVAYAVLHRLAQPPEMALQAGLTAAWIQKSMLAALAKVGQYVLPPLCLAGAALSWWRRRRREGLADGVASSPTPDALQDMTWTEFELLVGEAFRQQGYAVTEMGGAAPDGGVDLVLRKGAGTFLVQCKQWRAARVEVKVVRELYGVMAAQGAAGGFVVTSGRFTSAAREFAAGKTLKLVDGRQLHALLARAKAVRPAQHAQPAQVARAAPPATRGTPPAAPAVAAASMETVKPPEQGLDAAPDAPAAVPACPLCRSGMVLRTARKGASAGSSFWGCSAFPACRGTRAAQA